MRLLKTFISSSLMFIVISCGASTEIDTSLSTSEHKQNDSIMIVKNNSSDFCKARSESHNLVPSEFLASAQKVTAKSAEAQKIEQEIMLSDVNNMPMCDQETLNTLNQLTSGAHS